MSNDTQHYTNFEIFHSLVPKMKAVSPNITNWDELDKEENYDNYSYVIDAIATAYRSGYGRGQKGRSFLIGEKKAELQRDKDSGKLVCWIGKAKDFYWPSVIGTIGRLDRIDCNGDLWVFWPAGSCGVHYNEVNKKSSWCCDKKNCLRIDTNVKGNVEKGDKIIYLGTEHGFGNDSVWPSEVVTGVVDSIDGCGVVVYWDNPDVVAKRFHGHSHAWYEDIAKVIPWD